MRIWKEKIDGRTIHCADFTKDGERHRPKAASKKELDEIIDSINEVARRKKYNLYVEPNIITIKQLVEAHTSDWNLSDRNVRHSKSILEALRDHLGEDFPVHLIKTADIKGFIRHLRIERKKTALKSSTANRYMNIINAMFHQAEEHFSGLETWKTPRMPFEPVEELGRERLLTEEEQALVFFGLRAPRGVIHTKRGDQRETEETVLVRHTLADILELALSTGLRQGEGRTLRWSKIDFTVREFDGFTTYGEIRLTKTKNRRNRSVPLNRDARDMLLRRRAESSSEWVFPNSLGTAPISATTLYKVLKRVCRAVGVSYGRYAEDGFTFHDSRHTAVTGMLQRGADLKTIGSIVGHTDETMTMRYSHATAHSRAKAVSSLERGKNPASPVKIPTDKTVGEGN